MDKSHYLEIKKQLNFDKPLWITGLIIIAEALFLAVIIQLILSPHWLAYAAGQVLLALFFFQGFALMHECGHGNVHKSPTVNAIFGHFFSIFCFMPFHSWKHIHNLHHVWIGYLDKDPTLKMLRDIRESRKLPKAFQIAWKYWLPLLGLMQHITMWMYPITYWKEHHRLDDTVKQTAFSVLFLIVTYALIVKLFPEYITMRNLLPAFILYLMFQEFVNIPHHLGTPMVYSSPEKNKYNLWEQHKVSRSYYYPGLVELCTLNFDLHTEHHYFPNLPWYRLKKVRGMLMQALGSEYNDTDITWNFKKRKEDIVEIVQA